MDTDERRVLERVLGGDLREDQQVTIQVATLGSEAVREEEGQTAFPAGKLRGWHNERRTYSPEERAFLRSEQALYARRADARQDGFTLRDEANAVVAEAFRNGPLERLHEGKYSTLLEDDRLSRITAGEMRFLIRNACERMEQLLQLRESNPDEYASHVRAYNARYCEGWER
jgi:hypothetical protein